jgi:hypothetical protein
MRGRLVVMHALIHKIDSYRDLIARGVDCEDEMGLDARLTAMISRSGFGA